MRLDVVFAERVQDEEVVDLLDDLDRLQLRSLEDLDVLVGELLTGRDEDLTGLRVDDVADDELVLDASSALPCVELLIFFVWVEETDDVVVRRVALVHRAQKSWSRGTYRSGRS